jgi:hypothetical protein
MTQIKKNFSYFLSKQTKPSHAIVPLRRSWGSSHSAPDLAQCSKILYLEVVCVAPEDGELRHELPVDPPAELYEGRLLPRDGGVAPCTPCGS